MFYMGIIGFNSYTLLALLWLICWLGREDVPPPGIHEAYVWCFELKATVEACS